MSNEPQPELPAVAPYAEPAMPPRVVVSSPLSFAGSAQRIWPVTAGYDGNPWAKAGMITLATVLIVLAWSFVACWYCTIFLCFGVFVIPWRLLRRHQRRSEALQRELIDTIRQQQGRYLP